MTENNFQIDSAAVTDKGLSKKRPQNEDSYLEMNEHGLFAVADGVGGAQAGDVASQMAVKILAEAFVDSPKNGDAEEMMKVAIERANKAIFQKSHELPQLSTMATTVVALHIAGNIATIGHVGDSRLYRLDGEGNLYRETHDHSVVEEEVRAGRMTTAQAANHPSRNVISRALGADYAVEVDMKTIMFEPHTTFLLCSDGITRHIDDAELREVLLSNESTSNVVQKLKEICFERGAEDNLTAVIAQVTDKALVTSANETKSKSFVDYEESTIAAARSPLTNDSPSTNALIINKEITNEMQHTPVAEKAQPQETINKSDVSKNSALIIENSLPLRADNLNEKTETIVPQKSEIKVDIKSAHTAEKRVEKSGSGAFVKFLSSLLLLLLGGVLGAGAYYFWAQNYKEPIRETVMSPAASQPSPVIPYSAFEGSRRSIDKNPQAYIETNVMPPEKAEDFYLLGRAYLLSGKYADAKKSFEEARNRLAQVDETNSEVIKNEIAMGLAVINDPVAQKAFEKDLIENKPNSGTQTNSNANVSSSSSIFPKQQ
ncbi:MAG: protein phosphatase 2C domain-containing protein [Pyrinomonadaceae bacterium]